MKLNQKLCITTKWVINRGKRSKILSEGKFVKNISKNLQSFLEISPAQKEILLSHKLQDQAYSYIAVYSVKSNYLILKAKQEKKCENNSLIKVACRVQVAYLKE